MTQDKKPTSTKKLPKRKYESSSITSDINSNPPTNEHTAKLNSVGIKHPPNTKQHCIELIEYLGIEKTDPTGTYSKRQKKFVELEEKFFDKEVQRINCKTKLGKICSIRIKNGINLYAIVINSLGRKTIINDLRTIEVYAEQ
ncbi:MAG: hypothetical protein A2725_00380 [Candidatus Magasanikbacteria bacterium RIFCSPHIGHO2_01_FULL_33_34]|uniref:Uncharacterized protein n=1 Tax=Candidatus Magasanikbacteria bacterium RIFCSPHIGHO2_01_FULL_33_34 TaxID=1798671 RepID=A0A1F6LL30_9BACT|nr:MAG: hypothetical protein A2725_00380 [Candidatus Magasanikbacteria bacterium RIFCSPHIGHO2_01_FULL_33_34]OGH65817.1 MAG: hypothetical protein A3B83_03050 [Candidatus Magasanikbacteria bacterium RIFCSPHIGHO2_02_FULL_33_17]OGH75182.1 MAG: hypothetical protein A3A89_03645 [Candidatus Magasanikbacteria bacterium RIFCSPLOWO2_01_FULL_33_34]